MISFDFFQVLIIALISTALGFLVGYLAKPEREKLIIIDNVERE